jgi:cytoskeleton protein RodZ
MATVSVSEQLRRAREQQQLDIYQVAEITKIKTDHVRALESGNFAMFSAPVYIRGFVRTYATMLKLDVPRLLADLDTELGRSDRFRDPPPLTKAPRGPLDFVMLQLSRLNWRIAFGIITVVVFVGLAVVVVRSRTATPQDPLKDLAPGAYQPRKGKTDTLPLPGTTPAPAPAPAQNPTSPQPRRQP